MARGVNKVILVGTCGQDPEVRNLSNGNSVTNLSLATSEQWMDKQSGQRQERTEWHRVVLFGKVAEIAGQYLRKGSQCYIEGKLQTRSWDDKDGVKRYTTEIVVDMQGTLQLLGGRPQGQQGGDGYDQGGDPYNQGGGQQQYNQAPRQQAPRPQQQPQRQAPQQQPQQQQPAADFDSFDDDIPF